MNLLNTLMGFWQEDPAIQNLLAMIQPEVDRLETLTLESLGMASLEGAGNWILESWENAFGLPVDVSKTDTERKETIRAKLCAGDILTPEIVARLIASYYSGRLEMTEDAQNGIFTLLLVDHLGTPPYEKEIKTLLDSVKPVQLAYILSYRHLSLYEVEAMTLEELSRTTLDKFGGGHTYGND